MLVPAPTRYESVGCDDGRFISPKESQASLNSYSECSNPCNPSNPREISTHLREASCELPINPALQDFPPYAMRFLLLAWYNQSITLLLLSLRSSVRTSAIQANLIALGLSSASY